LLADAGLLPLATLARSDAPERLLRQVAEHVGKIESIEQRQNLAAGCYVLAGLRFDQPLLKQLFREETMRESVTYQEILQKGVQQGLKQGLQQEVELVLRQLRHRFGSVSVEQQQQIQHLSSEQLAALGEALLDFTSLNELTIWLASSLSD
jgi:predicted transposase YdaD